MKRPILPEKVHIIINNDYDYDTATMSSEHRFYIPYRWLVFNGQEKYRQWGWNKNYMKQINDMIGYYMGGDIYVVEWNIVQDIAFLMKSSNELSFDVNAYYTQLKEKDIKYFNATHIN